MDILGIVEDNFCITLVTERYQKGIKKNGEYNKSYTHH